MVLVRVLHEVSEDDLGLKLRDALLDRGDDVEQREGVETLVGQTAEDDFADPENIRCPARALLLQVHMSVPCGHAVGQDADPDLVAVGCEAGHRSPGSECLVVGMRGNGEDSHLGTSRVRGTATGPTAWSVTRVAARKDIRRTPAVNR